MKLKMSRNQIKSITTKQYALGYCEYHKIMSKLEPLGYNKGICGWNYDVYLIGRIAITTGYRGMIGDRIKSEEELIKILRDEGIEL